MKILPRTRFKLLTAILVTLLISTPVFALETKTYKSDHYGNQVISLNQVIVSEIKAQRGEIAFYYENLITGEKTAYHPDKVFNAASTIKLPLVLYVYQLAAENKISLDEYMTYTSGYYREGTGVIQHQKIGTRYTLRDLAQKALKHSDNIAYYMLRNRIGRSNFEKYLKSLGGSLVASRGINVINCKDYSIYLKAFYNFVEKHPELGHELKTFAANTAFEEHIAGGIKDVPISHKIGWLPKLSLYHDVGIVYDEQPYILIILSQSIPYKTQKQLFQNMASKTHQYHLKTQMIDLKQFVVSQGGTVEWNALNKTITAQYGSNILEIHNGQVMLNGEATLYSYNVNGGATYISPKINESIISEEAEGDKE